MLAKTKYSHFLPNGHAAPVASCELMQHIPSSNPIIDLLAEAADEIDLLRNIATDDLTTLYYMQQALTALTTLQKALKQALADELERRVSVNAWDDGEFYIQEIPSSRKVDADKLGRLHPNAFNMLLFAAMEDAAKNFKPTVSNVQKVLNSKQQAEVFYQDVRGYEVKLHGGRA
jgi:hypothetical protein